MAIFKPLIATAFLVAAVGSTQVGMADTSTEMKAHSSRTVTEVPASPSTQGTQVETHTSTSKMHKDEADGSVTMKKKSSTIIQEGTTKTDPFESNTVHSETKSEKQTTTVTP